MLTTMFETCPFCGKVSEIEVDAEDFMIYCEGELVQNAFPYLSSAEREVIISGICVECQTELFG